MLSEGFSSFEEIGFLVYFIPESALVRRKQNQFFLSGFRASFPFVCGVTTHFHLPTKTRKFISHTPTLPLLLQTANEDPPSTKLSGF